jgi:hypothetical protein
MQESLLHYIWQFQYFDHANLQTTSGENIIVFHPGFRNTDAGPDFSNARVKIGSLEWIGNVEIHIHSSGWNDHKHTADPAYENVVLHVVWKDDAPVKRKDNTPIPTFELQGRVHDSLILRYNKLLLNPETIPCSASIAQIRPITTLAMMEKALMARLESKAKMIIETFHKNNNDWEETCFQMISRNFGFKVNSEPLMALAKSVPYKFLIKHGDNLTQVEALLFGQAGFLDDETDESYFKLLKREYLFLSQKFKLQDKKLTKAQWKFLRLRPANFPTIRVAQLAGLLYTQRNIFSRLMECKAYGDLTRLLSARQSEYWQHHYLFGKPIDAEISALGKMSIDSLIINTVVPLMVAYGKSRDDQQLVDRAVGILQEVKTEENSIVKKWSTLGIRSGTAFDSQALIELHNNFCLRRKCLDCSIGSSLIRPDRA